MTVSNVAKNRFDEKQKLSTAELLFHSAQEMGLKPDWITQNGLFAISVDGQEHYVNFGRSSLNSHASISIGRNKYLTRMILERHGMKNIPFSLPKTSAEATAFLDLHKKIIAKPVEGSGSRNIHIITDQSQLLDVPLNTYILEKYITGKEVRYLVLSGKVIAVHLSEYGSSVDSKRSLKRISYTTDDWDQSLVASSLKIAQVLDLTFVAVDFLIDTAGNAHVLEVNTAPGMKWFHAPTTGPAIDVARQFLEAVYTDQTPPTSDTPATP